MAKKGIESPYFKNRIGEIHITNEGYEVEIIEYIGVFDCTIQFKNGYIIKNVMYNNIKKGTIRNPYHYSVHDVGYIGVGNHIATLNTKPTKKYYMWANLLKRGHSFNLKVKYTTYKDVTVCKEWHNFQIFAEWYEENYIEGFELDKDILIKGNKIYSPETCCFVPHEINGLFTRSDSNRGVLPIGTHKQNGYFIAQINRNGKQEYLGSFKTPEEAFQAYKTAKEDYIKEVAEKWKEQISKTVYQALINYNIEITD